MRKFLKVKKEETGNVTRAAEGKRGETRVFAKGQESFFRQEKGGGKQDGNCGGVELIKGAPVCCGEAEGAEKAGHGTGGAGQGAEYKNNGDDQHNKAEPPQASGQFHICPSFLSKVRGTSVL